VIVFHVNVAGLKSSFAGSEIYGNGVLGNRDRPEQSIFGGPRIEIVNLLTRRVKNVKSYEGEGAMVVAAVSANKFAAHEANVGFEVKELGSLAVDSVRAHASDCCPSDKAIEIGDGARLNTWGRQEHMKERSTGTKELQTAGNWKWGSTSGAVVSVKVERG
jgi:hypothetical protein